MGKIIWIWIKRKLLEKSKIFLDVIHGEERVSVRMASPAVIVTARVPYTRTAVSVATFARVRMMPTVTL